MTADHDPRRSNELDEKIANALAARRPAPSRAFQDRLRAAVARPDRTAWLVPAALAAVVATAAIAVLVLRHDRTDADDPLPTVATASEKVSNVPAPLPGGPAPTGAPDLGDVMGPYQSLLDGNPRGLALDTTQLAKLRDIGDDLAKQRVQLNAQREIALIELRRAVSGNDAERARATAILDRVTAADAALRRAELGAKLAAREVLDAKQRAQLDRRDPVASASKLMVNTHPAGAKVFLDGVLVGVSPVATTVVGGRHDLRFELAGYATQTVAAELRDGQDQTVAVELARKTTPPTAIAGTIELTTSPSGARVTIDGRIVGDSPLRLQLAPGSHRVHLAKDGLTARDVTVQITAGETQVVRAVLGRVDDMGLKNPFRDDLADPFATGRGSNGRGSTDRGSPVDNTELEPLDPSLTKPAGVGTLRVASRPFSEVFVDGKRIGVTPVIVKLATGIHKVTLVHDGAKTSRTVTVQSGKTEVVAMDFTQIE